MRRARLDSDQLLARGVVIAQDIQIMKRFRCAILILGVGLALAGTPRADMIGHGGMVRAVAFSPDGRRVLTGSFDFSAIVWDFEEQRQLARLDGHDGPVTAVAFVAGGEQAVTASDDRVVRIWRLSGDKPSLLHRLEGHTHKVMGLAVSADGRIIASGGWDKTVQLWDGATGGPIRTINVTTPVNAVAFVNAGKWLAVGGHDNTIRLLDVETGLSRGVLSGHQMGITRLRAAPGGLRLISASIDKTVRLWDVPELKLVRVLERHDSQVFDVDFLPDGGSAVSVGRDGFLIRWNLESGKIDRSIKAHDKIIWGVAVSPNGRFAVTGSSDETGRVWHLASGDRIGAEAPRVGEPQPWMDSNHPGARLYRKCARCHVLDAASGRRSGPPLRGLFGRRAGSVAGYNYSGALTDAQFVWNDETIFKLFDLGPDKFLPGTKMPVQRVGDPKRLVQLVDYLKQLTAPPTTGD